MATKDDLRGFSSPSEKVKSNRYDKDSELNEYLVDDEEIQDELNEMPKSGQNDSYSLSDEDENYIAEPDNVEQEEEENLSDNELNILQQLEENEEPEYDNDFTGDQPNGRPYQNKLCKPVLTVGKTTIGMSKAKLFGFLDDNGKLKIQPAAKPVERNSQYKKMNNISKPRELDLDLIDREEEPSFKPTKSKEALAAMKNAKCGYDFVARLNDNSDFLDRVSREGTSKGGGKLSKFELDAMEADYEVKQDKLQCPVCKKFQSFDEMIEKKRNCGQCRQKYEKLNITSGINFAKKAADKEKERKQKLREREIELYGAKSESYQTPKVKKVDAEMSAKENEDKKAPAKQDKIRENIRSAGRPSVLVPNKVTSQGDQSDAKGEGGNENNRTSSANGVRKIVTVENSKLLITKQRENENAPQQLIERLAKQNNDKALLMNETLSKLTAQYPSTTAQQKATTAARSNTGAKGQSRDGVAASGESGKDRVTKKFEKLLSVEH